MINTIEEIIAFWKIPPKKVGQEIHGQCPFCNPPDWVGDDRFYIIPHKGYGGCRRCGHHATFQEIIDRVAPGEVVSPDLVIEYDPEIVYATDPELFDETHVLECYQHVNRDFWLRNGWDDRVIDTFKLGYGTFNFLSQQEKRNLIPMKLKRDDGKVYDRYAFEGRLSEGGSGPKTKITDGLLGKGYYWEFGEGDTIVITEGPKDGITAFYLRYNHVWVEFGTSKWTTRKAELIRLQNPKRVIVFGDHDDAGKKWIQQIKNTLPDIAVFALRYPDQAGKGYDITDLNIAMRFTAREFIDNNLYEVYTREDIKFIEKFSDIDPKYVPVEKPLNVDLKVLRQEIQEVIRNYVDNYKDIKKRAKAPVLQLLKSPPGSGKSYAAVQEIQRLSLLKIKEYNEQQQLLLQQLEDCDDEEVKTKLKNKMKNMKMPTVLLAGPFRNGWEDVLAQGIDPDLIHNYEPRSLENCENLETVTKIAERGYNSRAFCNTTCPFRDGCKWLAQDEIRKRKPAVYVRHQNLDTSLIKEYHNIFIDEDATAIFDKPITVTMDNLVPVYGQWEEHLDPTSVKLLNQLVQGLRALLAHSEDLSGRDLIHRLAELTRGELESILTSVEDDLVNYFQPETLDDYEDLKGLPVRCLPAIFKILKEEYDIYCRSNKRFNSRLHTINGKLLVYNLNSIEIPSTRPIVVLDGTAMPELYSLLFKRKVYTYSPDVYSALGRTTVLYGTDFTRQNINKQVGSAIADWNNFIREKHVDIEDIFGEQVALPEMDENMYDSAALNRAINIIKYVAEKHKDTLVVCYKSIRPILEQRIKTLYPHMQVYFSHYGSLRGTNKYKDVESCLLIGCYRHPYSELWRRISAWGFLRNPEDYISPDLISKATPYHSTESGHYHTTYAHPFAQAFADKIEQGESIQCLQRIRLHTSQRAKYAYIAASRPLVPYVDQVVSLPITIASTMKTKQRTAKEFMLEIFEQTKRFPKYEEIQKMFNISSKTISKLKTEIENDYSR